MSLTFCPGLKYNGEKPSRRLGQPMRQGFQEECHAATLISVDGFSKFD